MGLLDKLKSLIGSNQDGHSPARDTEPKVTVEHEPAAESEHAVKGTDGIQQQMNDEQESEDSTTESVSESEQGATDESKSTAASTTEHTETGPVSDEPVDDELVDDEPGVDERAESSAEEQAAADDEPATEEQLATEEEPAADADAATDESTDSPLVEEIKGIGPTYAERLESVDIETVADLAAANPAEVADAAQTGESRAVDWIERAQDF